MRKTGAVGVMRGGLGRREKEGVFWRGVIAI
jgi:hypothetical protein